MLEHYPHWAQLFARKYFGKTVNQFVLHGNVHDLVMWKEEETTRFDRLRTFLGDELFGSRDIVLFYDRSSGIQFRDKESQKDFYRAVTVYDTISGTDYANKIPRDPVKVFGLMENYFRLRLAEEKSIAVVIDYAETIVPMSESSSLGTDDRNALVYLSRWSHDPLFLSSDFSIVLLAENLKDLHQSLVQSPYVYEIHMTLPDEDARKAFITHAAGVDYPVLSEVPEHVLAHQTAGLSFVNLQSLIYGARENEQPITYQSLIRSKKELIEAEAYGLLEFVETRFNLDAVAGHKLAKAHLREAALALRNGRHDVMPMGYLVCGPVGTGKTFLVTCFASEIGVPMVKLKNFRSQWQGVTESNLEKILALLKAMSPVAVMIDEADAYLGDRNSSGDSGVSSRVFAQIAQFMSNTDHRGKIVWFLMTARPDLMPVDLKRQGRAEEHLALFHPVNAEERTELFLAMKKKTRLDMDTDEIPELIKNGDKPFSGADMEAALTRAKFKAAALGQEKVSLSILDQVLDDFLPPSYPEEIEMQTLVAVLECTSKSMLPNEYKHLDRVEIAQRIEELKMMIG